MVVIKESLISLETSFCFTAATELMDLWLWVSLHVLKVMSTVNLVEREGTNESE